MGDDDPKAAAFAAWPDVIVSRTTFDAFLSARPEHRADHLEDLLLACACLEGSPEAWRHFDREHLGRVASFVARVDTSVSFADDIRQRLAEKLLHDPGGTPKLALYTGRGPLSGWLRVVAVREAHNAKRGRDEDADAVSSRREAPGPSPESAVVKARYRTAFRAAFEEALRAMPVDQRNILRLHYLDGLTLPDTARAYGVSRATAARWLADARAEVKLRVGSLVGQTLGADESPSEIYAFVESQLDLTLRSSFDAFGHRDEKNDR
jgi:RNA polymerase sigma-70 factor (ECF subfamily)